MLLIKKKNILQELAVALYLNLQLYPETNDPTLKRARDRGTDALESALPYTGHIGDREVEHFLKVAPLHFSIDCGQDIIKGDMIRFTEQVFNNRAIPAKHLGRRGIIAEVIGFSMVGGRKMFNLRVIRSGGVSKILPDTFIRRTLRIIARMEVMRAPWDDEAKRKRAKDPPEEPQQLKIAKRHIRGRYEILKLYNKPKD